MFSTPENLVVGITGALGMKESHFLSKIYFEKMQWSISEIVIARAFKPLSLCSAPLKNLVVGITGALEMKETHFLSKIYFQKML